VDADLGELGRRRRRGNGGDAFSPFALFANGEQGVWYDPSDLTPEKVSWALANPGFTSAQFLAVFPGHALFQDSAGTTPVTALGQSVGRVLDKSGKGNHAIQATSASRPTLQARANLLTYSEQFDNPAWTKTSSSVTANDGVAPDGTTTADLVTASSATNGRVTQTVAFTGDGTKCVSFFVKQGSATVNRAVLRDNTVTTNRRDFLITWTAGVPATSSTAGTGTIYPPESLGNGWWRILFAADNVVAANVNQVILYPDDALGTGTAYFWGAQAEDATTPSTYQRVVTATDYADVGLPRNLLFDGVDDSLATVGNVDFTATDKMSVFTGLTKNTDGATGQVVELSADSAANNGSFALTSPTGAAATTIRFRSTGTLSAFSTDSSFAAPVTGVITGLSEILTDTCILRKNGVQVATSASDQGTGTYLSYPLYIGRRNNTNLPFNGRLFQLIVRGAATDSVTVINAEQYVAQRTGVTL